MTWKLVTDELPEYSAYFLVTLKGSSKIVVDVIFLSKNNGWKTKDKEMIITHWTDIPYKYMNAIDNCRQCNGAPSRVDFAVDGKFGSYCEECRDIVTLFDPLLDLSQILPAK